MGIRDKAQFVINKDKCIKCGKCINTCSGMVLEFGEDGYPYMKDFERFGWRGCWRCEHCLAVCPKGAISILGKKPEDSMPLPPKEMGTYMEQLITTRRSCRRFLDKNVDDKIITGMLAAMSAAPTGGNAHGLGTAIMSYPAEVLNELAPEAREMLGIPKNHYLGLIIGFGYPEIEYARGVQKDRGNKVHRYSMKH